MAEYPKLLRAGTYAQYQAITTKDNNVLYFCTDNGKLFKGSIDFTNSLVSVTASSLPSTGVPGKIYYVTDQNKWKTYIGSAYVEIGNPIDTQGSSTTSTITSTSPDDHVPSAKNVYTYGQEILAAASGGSAVVKNVEAGTADAKIKVTKGDNTSSQFAVPGVVTAVSDNSSVDAGIKFTKTNTSGTTADTNVLVTGVVTTPTWNNTSRILTLPVSGGTTVEVNIGKDLVISSGYYDSTNKQLVLILNDEEETEIRIDVEDLIDIYVGGSTSTASVSVSSDNIITSAVKIDQATGNAITVVSGTNGGLRVDLSDYALQDDLDALATATTSWGTFT